MKQVWQDTLMKAVDRLVREGVVEHAMVNGKPGIRLIKAGVGHVSLPSSGGGEPVETPAYDDPGPGVAQNTSGDLKS